MASVSGCSPPEGLRTWPQAVRTDDQGRIAVSGIGRGARRQPAACATSATPHSGLFVDAARATPATESTLVLESARIIEGRVLADDTGQPIPNAMVSVETFVKNQNAHGISHVQLPRRRPGAVRHEPGRQRRLHADRNPLRRRAVPARAGGSQVDQGGGEGEPGYQGPPRRRDPRQGHRARDRPAPGRVEHPVRPGSRGRRRDLGLGVHRGQPGRRLVPGRRPARQGAPVRLRADSRLHPRARSAPVPCSAIGPCVRHAGPARSATVPTPSSPTRSRPAIRRSRSTPPCGRRDASRGGSRAPTARRSPTPPSSPSSTPRRPDPSWRWQTTSSRSATADSSCTASTRRGPRASTLDPEHEWGATVELSGKQAGEEVTIRLQPCGRATVRFVGPDGRPVARHQPLLEFVATPDPGQSDRMETSRRRTDARIRHDREY